MPLKGGHSRAIISENIHEMVKAGHPHDQAVAVALHKADYAEGGEVDDHDAVLNHVATECMSAIQAGDQDAFRQSFHVLVADILHKLSDEMETKEGE